MPLDLSALAARCAAMPAGATVTVIIPRGNPVTIGGAVYQEQDTFVVPAELFTQPATPATTPVTGDVPQQERFMVAVATLNIRATPDRNAVLRGTLATGERVAVTGSATNGYVALAGDKGWVLESGLNT